MLRGETYSFSLPSDLMLKYAQGVQVRRRC